VEDDDEKLDTDCVGTHLDGCDDVFLAYLLLSYDDTGESSQWLRSSMITKYEDFQAE
jgi:hypothetical protein